MKKLLLFSIAFTGALVLLIDRNQHEEPDSTYSDSSMEMEGQRPEMTSVAGNSESVASDETNVDSFPQETPAALTISGFPKSGSDPIAFYISNESRATFDSESAFNAFRVLNSCSSLPSLDEIPSEMDAEIGLTPAYALCRQIQENRTFRRDELLELASSLGSIEATIILPSFPPPFSQSSSDSRNVSEYALDWQQRTIEKLQDVADSGNTEAQLRLARLFAGEFPAYQDGDLAKSYVELALETGHLTPYQISLAQNLLRKLPE